MLEEIIRHTGGDMRRLGVELESYWDQKHRAFMKHHWKCRQHEALRKLGNKCWLIRFQSIPNT